MIFSPDLAEKIMRGEKTETRRPRTGENPTGKLGGWINNPCRYQPGRTYAVQPGRGKKSIGRIRVLSVLPEVLHEMTDESFRREGFANAQEFQAKWLSLYRRGNWLDPVWTIRFEVVEP